MIIFNIEHDHELCNERCMTKQWYNSIAPNSLHIETFLKIFYVPFECCTENKNFESLKLINILFVGEAPGFHESKNKQPFYTFAPSGRILRQVIKDLQIKYYAIANIVECRPIDIKNEKFINKTPTMDECNYCVKNLGNFIKLLNNNLKVILLGKTASRTILCKLDKSIDSERTTATQYVNMKPIKRNNISYYSNFHPRFIQSNGGLNGNKYKEYLNKMRDILND